MLRWILAVVVVLVAVFLIWYFLLSPEDLEARREVTIVIEGGPSHWVVPDPDQLVAAPGERVQWHVENRTGVPLEVELTDFKRRRWLLPPQSVPPPFQGGPPRGSIPVEGAPIEATVQREARRGTYRYAIVPMPGVRYNTPEIVIRP